MTAIDIDYSRPLATLLREGTVQVHELVAHSPGAKLLNTGTLPKHEYVRYLMMLWHIYDALEKALDRHATHPCLEPTYNPTLLARASSLSADISYLLDEVEWHSHPLNIELLSPPPPQSSPTPLIQYLNRIHDLSFSQSPFVDPSPLLAHAYVRYLGDLSGGQTIRHILSKSYNLEESTELGGGRGLEFYNFKELRSGKMAGLGEMKRIKEWFREGLNTAGEVWDGKVKAAIVEEAKQAFILNSGILNMIRVDPTTTDESQIRHRATKVEIQEEEKGEVVYDSEVAQERGFPLSSVIAVISAICLTHFILVTGGFTGDRGYAKLIETQRWLANAWYQYASQSVEAAASNT